MAIRSIAYSACARLPLMACATLLLAAMAAPTCAQEPTEDRAESRLAPMMRRAEQLKIRFADSADRAAPELMKSPVLRTNDPTRNEVDGAVWLWLDGKRPVAALGVMYYASAKWNYELSSMTDEALEVTGRPTWTWKPPAAKRDWIVMEEPVPDALRARQLTLRTLPRRFDASEVRRGERFPLHLLNQPIYTYADPDNGLIDGAVFAISYGTNPEILVQLEARERDGKRQWHVAFTRLSAAEVTVRLKDQEIWKVAPIGVNEYDPRGPYFATNEPDRSQPTN